MRKLVYNMFIVILFTLICSGCEGKICVEMTNESNDTIWCYSGYSHSEFGNTVLAVNKVEIDKRGGIAKVINPGDSAECISEFVGFGNFNFKSHIESYGPIHIFVFKKDTINIYGETTALNNHSYEVEYVLYSDRVIKNTGRSDHGKVVYPPTQVMMDAGVGIFYPEDVPPGPDHR